MLAPPQQVQVSAQRQQLTFAGQLPGQDRNASGTETGVPMGWEAIMGSVHSSVSGTGPDMTRCDFTAISRSTGPSLSQSGAGQAYGGASGGAAKLPLVREAAEGGAEAMDALEDALDKLFQNKV
jgi:hypothetical protein